MNLNHKKVLFIAPRLFGYEKDIEVELTYQGAVVNFIPENLDHINLIYKLLCSLPHKVAFKWIHTYFIRRINKFDNYDVVFVIRGRWLDEFILKMLKSQFNAKYIMYQWDSVKNVPNIHEISKFFDEIFTFDRADSAKFSADKQKWKYRPLFFSNDFIRCKSTTKQENVDFLYVGSLHSGRAHFLKVLQTFVKDNNFTLKSHLFMKRLNYLKRRYFNREYIELEKNDIQFKSINRNELITYMGNSKIIVDFTNPNQTGLTMRSIECLGVGKKLITNNKIIVEERFFNSGNIFVYNEDTFDVPYDFLNSPYIEVEKDVYNQYTIQGWVSDIFHMNDE